MNSSNLVVLRPGAACGVCGGHVRTEPGLPPVTGPRPSWRGILEEVCGTPAHARVY